jgi:hypothetical protein
VARDPKADTCTFDRGELGEMVRPFGPGSLIEIIDLTAGGVLLSVTLP